MLHLRLGVDNFASGRMCEWTTTPPPADAPIGLRMNARAVLIPLLCIGALALACGPRSHTEASLVTTFIAKDAPPAAPAPKKQAKKQSGRIVTRVTGVLAVKALNNTVDFAFDVTNDGSKNVELTFPDGQTHDFTVLDANGREVYRWAKGRMFTQSVQTKSLEDGETMHIAEHARATLPHGSYVAVATLRSSNFPVQERVAFELR